MNESSLLKDLTENELINLKQNPCSDSSAASPFGPCIVMELMPLSLAQYMRLCKKNNKTISLSLIRSISIQLFDALYFLHGTGGYIHSDIKPENILISVNNDSVLSPNILQTADVNIKLADFGNALTMNNEKIKSFDIQTKEYRAPEILFENIKGITPAIDLWSVGVILYELIKISATVNNNKQYAPLFALTDRYCEQSKESQLLYKMHQLTLSFPKYIFNHSSSLKFAEYEDAINWLIQLYDTNRKYDNVNKDTMMDNDGQKKLNNKVATHCFDDYSQLKIWRQDVFSVDLIVNCGLDRSFINMEFVWLLDMISCLLDSNPFTRFTSLDAINHRFIYETNDQYILSLLEKRTKQNEGDSDIDVVPISSDEKRQMIIDQQILAYNKAKEESSKARNANKSEESIKVHG